VCEVEQSAGRARVEGRTAPVPRLIRPPSHSHTHHRESRPPPPPPLPLQWSVSNNVITGLFSPTTTTCSGGTDYVFSNVPTTGTCVAATVNGSPLAIGAKLYAAPAYTPSTTTSGASETATAAAAVVGAAAAIAMAARTAY
jgi:hypothetical protein